MFAFNPQADPTLENNKINWFVPVTGSQNDFLKPGQTKTYSFVLANGADPTFRGHAGALDTFGFSGDTLGCPPPPPPQTGGGNPGPGIPVRQHGPFYLAEAYPALVQSFGLNSGISADACFLNGTTQAPAPAADAVPGLVCLAKGVGNLLNNPFVCSLSSECVVMPDIRRIQNLTVRPAVFNHRVKICMHELVPTASGWSKGKH